jgi:hypothetical protein
MWLGIKKKKKAEQNLHIASYRFISIYSKMLSTACDVQEILVYSWPCRESGLVVIPAAENLHLIAVLREGLQYVLKQNG